MEVSISRQVGQLKILVVLLIFGVPLQQLATAQSAQQSANNAAAYAAKADAAAAAAQNASYDAQQTLATDQSNGAISDQLLEDKNVANATQTASIGASDAAQQADKAASDAQTAANLGNSTAAATDALQAQERATMASAQNDIAQAADLNQDNDYGDPSPDQQAVDNQYLALTADEKCTNHRASQL